MSALAQQFGQLGESLAQAVEAEVERRARSLLGAFIHEVAVQLEPIRRAQATEKQLADDRLETIMKRFDEQREQLQSIAMALSTNGSGGDHA